MTTIRLGVLHPTGTATDARSTGSVECVPTVRRVVDGDVILPDAFVVALSATADVTVVVAPTTTAWVWRVLERVSGGSGGWRYLAVPDSAEVVDYAALVEVDPATLDPIDAVPTVAEAIAAGDAPKLAAAGLDAAAAALVPGAVTATASALAARETAVLASARATTTADLAVPASATRVAGDAVWAAAEIAEPMLLQAARVSKGTAIGVGPTKGVIALRFDDWQAAFKANIYALLKARGLPAGYACISRLDQQPAWTTGVTSADLVSWYQNGIEFHSHGTDHNDPSPQGDAGLVDQIVNSKAEIEALGIKVQGWMQPGATQLGVPIPYGADFTKISDLYTTRAGQLIRATYPISESYAVDTFRDIPTGIYHGLDHLTVSDGLTLASVKGSIDSVIQLNKGLELMTHSGNLGGVGMSLVDYTALLDYIVAKWDAGLIEVLTPSGLTFADRGTQRLDLIYDGSFENTVDNVANPDGWSLQGFSPNVVIDTGGGRTGANFARILSTSASFCIQRPQYLGGPRRLGGETFLFEGWCRSNGAGTTVPRVQITDYTDTSRLSLNLTRPAVTNVGWTRVRHAFSMHPLTTRLSVGVARNSGNGIDWDDISVKKV